MICKKDKTVYWIPLAFATISILQYIGAVPKELYNILYLPIFAVIIIHFMSSCVKKTDAIFCISFIFVIIFSGIISGLHTNNLNLSIYFKSICYVLIAFLLLKIKQPTFACKVMFYGTSIYFTIILLTRDVNASNNYFIGLSRNYYSILLFVLLVLYYTSINFENCSHIPIWPAICYLIVSVLAVGRGGILTAFIMLAGILLINHRLYRNKSVRNLFAIIVLILILTFIIIRMKVSFFSSIFTRFEEMGFGSAARVKIYFTYVNILRANPMNFILGGSNQASDLLVFHEGNLHNTFLQMHSTYGLLFSLLVVIRYIISMWRCYKNKRYLIVLLGSTFAFRAMMDFLGFAFFSEFLFYYFCLYDVCKEENPSPIKSTGMVGEYKTQITCSVSH